MTDNRILTIQDISCVGQCSLTVALPIVSACGIETAILPSAVLSNHTAFSSFTFRDLTEEIPKIRESWENQDTKFAALYTGYLGSAKQINLVLDVINSCIDSEGVKVIDPAMADGGKLYSGFNMDYVEEMKKLCAAADIILPNITEACIMTGTEYKTDFNSDYIELLINRLTNLFSCKIILTGVSFTKNKTGVAVYDGDEIRYYEHEKVGLGSHGTGDVYASAFVGALMRGKSLFDAAKIAADFTLLCIKNTVDYPNHWYGVRFEGVLPELINMVK